MADLIRHKRSSVPSAVPAAGDLELGELAVNVADGRAFMKKADGSVVEVGAGGADPLLWPRWCPNRDAIPAGYVAADGQTLSRATYPDAWAGIVAGNVPTVAEATWQSTPTERGKFSSGDGSTTFRLPDYNGKFAGSLGAVFLRGDGELSAAVAGVIQRDAMQHHVHETQLANNSASGASVTKAPGFTEFGTDRTTAGIAGSSVGTYPLGLSGSPVVDGSATLARTASETRPLNVTGCWVIKLFGAVVNVGSADAAQLASDYANLAGRVSTLQTLDSQIDFTIIYPNGGSAASPANVSDNTRYVEDNPFPGFEVIAVAQVLYSGNWGDVPMSQANPSATGTGVEAHTLGDDLIVQTGDNGLIQRSSWQGNPFGHSGNAISGPLPCRVKVWKVKGAIA